MIRVFEPKIDTDDIKEVSKTLFETNISGTSPVVREFETKLAKKFDRKYAVALSNGSVALDVAFNLHEFRKSDEVIIPSFTIISCLSAVIRSGAKPVFCDVDPLTWNMTLENVEAVVTKKTKAVLMVHTYGLTAEAKRIQNFCKKNNLILIEDAAEAHGQNESGLKCGSFGKVSTMSFYANKHITTGEGGAILTNSKEKYNLANQIINLDFTNKSRFKHKNFYWNYRLGGMQASLGISQLNKLEKTIKNKITQGAYYNVLLEDHKDKISLQPMMKDMTKNHFWVFGVLLNKQNKRDKVMEKLLDKKIETRPFFWPLHLQPALGDMYKSKVKKLKISENLGKNGLYIPIGTHVSKQDQEFIIDSLLSIIEST